ncbi:hypothetical protein [Streptomyces sp. NPDC059080]|uniref:hypothetical protein n=1 Tax=Streptomyces sp. NPDC059080 TaxID=3346718 RepID=UPI0036A6491A
MTKTPTVREHQLSILSAEQVSQEWARVASGNSQVSSMRSALLDRLGVRSDADLPEPQFFGTSGTFHLDGPVPVPQEVASPPAQEVLSIQSSLIVQSRTVGDQQVAECVATTQGTPAGLSQDRVFLLTTTNDHFLTGVEEHVTGSGGQLVTVDGWWDALTSCLTSSDCGDQCVSAALTCPPATWAVYLACLAGRCGLCVVKCAACATCDCTWWCRVAAGCCNN